MSRNSDRRKIKDVQNVTGQHALQKIAALQPVQYRHIDEDPALPTSVGFIAQDFEKEFPSLIRKRKNDDGIKPIPKPKPPRVPQPHVPEPTVPLPTEPEPAPDPTVPLSVRMRLLADQPIDPTVPTAPAPVQAAEEVDEGSISDMQGYTILSFEELIPLLVGSIKELKTLLDESKAKVSELEKKVAKLQPTLNGV